MRYILIFVGLAFVTPSHAQDMQKLARDSGCLKCHGINESKIGPSFRAIGARYEVDPAGHDLALMTLSDSRTLPEQGKSLAVVALVDKALHVRIFDHEGQRVTDWVESEASDKALTAELKRHISPERLLTAGSLSAEERRTIARRATEAAGLTPQAVRDRLIRTVRQGGKGHWTQVSKHVPMPSFEGRLSEEQMGSLVDWILTRAGQPHLTILKTGLGTGTVASDPAGIDCGGDCGETVTAGTTVTLTATPDSDSKFVGWEEGASKEITTITDNPAAFTLDSSRTVRAVFALQEPIQEMTDLSPGGIRTYLETFPHVNTPARFLASLPAAYRQNWILMTRSESLQTGTATSPRLLLQGENAENIFTIGMTQSSSYPGSHPDAVEYMQFDSMQKNFRFHEIVLAAIPAMGALSDRVRGVSIDDAKCAKCHSTRNVINKDTFPGTSGTAPGTVPVKYKPNWDPYDSWAGMLPFNRDRIYQGSVEAAAFRKLLDLRTWSSNEPVRMIVDQLDLQPGGVPTRDEITRRADWTVKFNFDPADSVQTEPAPSGSLPVRSSNYDFNGLPGTGAPSPVIRSGDGSYVVLRHSASATVPFDEGRGVELFDFLGGGNGVLNQLRVADEIAGHAYATGGRPIDVRPVALAIALGEINYDPVAKKVTASSKVLTIDFAFFDSRHGLSISQLVKDTDERAVSIPRRKADFQKLNLNRSGDYYQLLTSPLSGLIAEYGDRTSAGRDDSPMRVRQEIFRRPVEEEFFPQDRTGVMNELYVDRESYGFNTETVALFRYFLEPLGVSVDKWSLGVRGRSRSYAFADVFPSYTREIISELSLSLKKHKIPGLVIPADLNDPEFRRQLIDATNLTLGSLPDADETPPYTDVQRIFNKSCIECHGGLNYPPYANSGTFVDLSEEETPASGDRMRRAYNKATIFTGGDNPYLLELIKRSGEACDETNVSTGMMPCGGPALSQADVETVGRWIAGGTPYSFGDPHIRTVNGVNYDFQAAGEFVLLKDPYMELQVRQVAVSTATPLGPDKHTDLTSCVSVNAGIALRMGEHRITYLPNLNGQPDPQGLQLRVNADLVQAVPPEGMNLRGGVRITRTPAPGGIQINGRGGSAIIVTPQWWDHQKLWFLNIDSRAVRATDGLMGTISAGDWLPLMPDGANLGPRPEGLQDRYDMLYGKLGTAWSVTNETSLFDYAAGTNAGTFSIANWPGGIQPGNCQAPSVPGGPAVQAPQAPLSREKAEDLCREIENVELRNLAIIDVMTTGEESFARSYLLVDQKRRQPRPAAPVPSVPLGARMLVNKTAALSWTRPDAPNAGELTYFLYVWPTDVEPDEQYAHPVEEGDFRTGTRLAVTSLKDLAPGKDYYWKVVAEDKYGDRTESKIFRFKVQK